MGRKSLERVGVRIGHYSDKTNITGLTVFITEKGSDIGIDIRGSSTGSYNTEAYGNPKAATRLAHGLVLTGGSSYGLESLFGVMQYLEEYNIGNKTKNALIPGITGGVIYDLNVGSAKIRPTKTDGYRAAQSASYDLLREGNIGVGTGATTGKWIDGKQLKGGFGVGEVVLPNDILVCAFVVTNAVGDVINPLTGKFYYDEGGFDLSKRNIPEDFFQIDKPTEDISSTNTTLGVIATNVAMSRDQLLKVAEIAQDGMARSIFPVHTMSDGDIVFALSSHSGERKRFPDVRDAVITDLVGLAASDALANAIKSSMIHAETIEGYPAYISG